MTLSDSLSSTAPSHTSCVPLTIEELAILVSDFYVDVRRDPLLGPVFQQEVGNQWDEHLQRMVDFWTTVTLGTRTFRGNLVHRHMQLQGVTPAHFAAWIRLWNEHTQDRFDVPTTYRLRRVAYDIGRQLFEGYFDKAPPFAPGAAHAHREARGALHAGQSPADTPQGS